jgi:hypothetical protein
MLLVSTAYRAFFFSLISKHYVLSAYDVLAGFTCKTFNLHLEKLTIQFTQNFIFRDLRLKFFYSDLFKSRSKNFIFIPECLIKWNDKKSKINDDVLRCAIVGWIDNDKVKLTNVIHKLLLMDIHVHIYTNKWCLCLLKKDFDYFNENYKNFFHIEGRCFGDEFIKALSNYHFGLSPHEIDNQLFPDKNYLRYASSSRVVSYVESGLINVFSKKSIYLDFFCRKNNAKKIYMHDFIKINSKKELINLYNDQIEIKKIKIKTKYFDKIHLSNKIYLFFKNI